MENGIPMNNILKKKKSSNVLSQALSNLNDAFFKDYQVSVIL